MSPIESAQLKFRETEFNYISPKANLDITAKTASRAEEILTGNEQNFRSVQLYDHSSVQRFNLERLLNADLIGGFRENYPAAQGLKFSETKSACKLAYDGQIGDVYRFPDGKTWRVTDVRQDTESGFRAAVLQPTDANDRRVVLTFAGTNNLSDWQNNISQGTGHIPAQYRMAANLAGQYREKYGENLILTGHSLGGGLASYASIVTGAHATAINSAPLSTGTFPPSLRHNSEIKNRITQYYVPGEILTDFAGNKIVENAPFISNVRPGNLIPVPGSRREMPSIPFTKFDDLYNLGVSVHNHLLGNLATDVPNPVKVSD